VPLARLGIDHDAVSGKLIGFESETRQRRVATGLGYVVTDAQFHVIATSSPEYRVDMATMASALEELGSVAEFALPRERVSGAELERVVAALEGADGLLVRIGTLSREIIERLPRLKVVALHGVGVDQVDVAAATEHGVVVTNVPGGNTSGVVELTVGLMIAMLRRIPAADAELRANHDWDGARFLGHEIGSRTVGLVGFGNVARGVARVCRALGAEVVATRRSAQEGSEEDVRLLPFDEVVRRADILSVHVPLNDETRGMIDRSVFGQMKPASYLVNVARGPIVVQDDLVAALQSGRLAGAALDVLESEPPDFNSPLFNMENVVLTPHMAGSSHESLETIARRASEDIARVLRGEQALHAVNEASLTPRSGR
jgi:D-3-phosphoglycerate dehydrogenase